ncbi:OB-fold protein [Lachnoanaerobaculum gingivalis]
MSNNKMTTCKTCGKEMAKSAKVCPSCGAKNKKPFFTKPWFIVIVALIIIGAIASGGKSKSGNTTAVADKTNSNNSEVKDTTAESTTIAIEYVDYTVDDLMAQLEENALKASNDHKGENVRITGKLGVIDSSGKYITLYPNTDFAITGIQCYIKNDDTKSKVAELSKDSLVTLTGKITDVGEVLGYSLNIDNIE